jgi:hypothetical protein
MKGKLSCSEATAKDNLCINRGWVSAPIQWFMLVTMASLLSEGEWVD